MYLFIILQFLPIPSSLAGSEDFLPWDNLTQLAGLEQTADYSLKLIVLTMNRPQSLLRLLRSINRQIFPGFMAFMEATYPYAIKKQRKARNAPSFGDFWCLELCLYGRENISSL